jgi:hypothetical protein
VRDAAERSARVETVVRTDFRSKTQEFRTTGVFDYARDRSELVTEHLHATRTITLGDVSYSSGDGAALPAGKTWLRSGGESTEEHFERTEAANAAQDEIGVSRVTLYAFDSSQPTPTGYVDYLRALGAQLRHAGRGEVRGVATERLQTTISQLAAARYDLEKAGWKQANIERYLESVVDTTTEVEVWVDADDVVRRVVETMRGPDDFGPPGFEPPTTVTTTEFFDFGVDVAIEAPPPDEVMEWEEWARLAEQEQRARLDEGLSELPPLGEGP